MSQDVSNLDIYTISTEKDIATLLSTFNSQYIFDIIQDHLRNKFDNTFFLTKPNVVMSFEQTFKNLEDQFPMDRNNILDTRYTTYMQIIEILLNEYKFSIRTDDNFQPYTVAYYMYDFFVSNFARYIAIFFANYLYQERTNIYNYFNLEEFKKNKDSTTIYGKKIYNDTTLAVINANLIYILDNMASFDITFETIIKYIYKDPAIENCLLSCISPIEDFYKNFYCAAFKDKSLRPLYITYTRLEFQKMQGLSIIKGE